MFGTILTNALNAGLGEIMPGMDVGKLQALTVQVNTGAAPGLPEHVRAIITDAITHTFMLSLLVVTCAMVAILMIPEIPLKSRAKGPPPEAASAPGAEEAKA